MARGFGQFALSLESGGKIVMRQDRPRRDRKRLRILLSRLEGLALRFENIADIDVGRAVVGPERERLFVARNRLIGTTKPRECVAAIVMSFEIIRLVCDGIVKAGDGFDEFSCGAEDDTDVIVRLSKIGPE